MNKITLQDLQSTVIGVNGNGKSITLANAEDYCFKHWLRDTLIEKGYTPNQIEVSYNVTPLDRVLVVNQLARL